MRLLNNCFIKSPAVVGCDRSGDYNWSVIGCDHRSGDYNWSVIGCDHRSGDYNWSVIGCDRSGDYRLTLVVHVLIVSLKPCL